MPYSEMPLADLVSRAAHLTSLLQQRGQCGLSQVDLELHQVELELQNRELKNAVAELEASRADYVELFDLAPFGYVLLDRNGVIADLNLPAAKLLERDRAMLLGKPFFLYLFESNSSQFIDYLRECHLSPWLTVDVRPR